MRIEKDHPKLPAVQRGEKLAIWIDGRETTAYAGETVSAVLMAEEIRAYGYLEESADEIRDERPSIDELPIDKLPFDRLRERRVSAFFCGMGICFGCVVQVDGLRCRACLTAVEEGMVILTRPVLRQDQAMSYNARPDNE